MANADPVRTWIMAQCGRKALSPDGLGAQVDAGELSEQEALISCALSSQPASISR
jgi:hypothetical protein